MMMVVVHSQKEGIKLFTKCLCDLSIVMVEIFGCFINILLGNYYCTVFIDGFSAVEGINL